MKSRKVLLALVLTMTLCLIAGVAMAATVATVGDVSYETFGDAVTAARTGSDKTITIVGEVPGFSFSVDMTGITIQGSETGVVTGMLNVTGGSAKFVNATIKNLKFNGGCIVFSTATKDFTNFTIDNCVFEGPGAGAAAIQIQKASGVSVDGLTITNNKINNYTGSGILLNGGGGDDCKVTIENNVITNVTNNGIQALNIENLSISKNIISNSGSPFNVYGGQNTLISNNDVTLKEGKKFVVTYVTGSVVVTEDNSIVDSNGEEVILTSNNCHSENDWAAGSTVAVGASKDSSGKYTSGTFVGSTTAKDGTSIFASNVMVAEFTEDGGKFMAVGTSTIEDIVASGNTSVSIVSGSGSLNLPAGTQVTNMTNNTIIVNGNIVAANSTAIAAAATLKNRTPQTGDNSNIALWLSLMAISALSFVALGRKSRFN